jgi:hypothetical protein
MIFHSVPSKCTHRELLGTSLADPGREARAWVLETLEHLRMEGVVVAL